MVTTLRATVCCRCWGKHFEPSGAGNVCLLCDGRGHIENCNLSDHFTFGELVATSHQEFPNDPDAAQIENLRRLCLDLLEPIRAKVGPLRVTSGFRSRMLDAHVAGPEWLDRKMSAHAIGAAADVQPCAVGKELRDIIEAAKSLPGLEWDQLILEGGCCHCAIFAPRGLTRQRREVLVRLPGATAGTFRYAQYTGEDWQLEQVV